MSPELLIFTHIPKAAGSTMAKWLRLHFGPEERVDLTPLTVEERAARVADLPAKVRLVFGHARYGLHLHTRRPCRYFTVLREPLSRVISAYYYVRRTPEHRYHERVTRGNLALEDFAMLQPNLQTKYLAGTEPLAAATASDLALAKEHLERDYAVAGLAGCFDESLLLLAHTFQWSAHPYASQNVASREARGEISEQAMAGVRAANEYDQELFEFAAQRLQRQLDTQPESFQRELQDFRQRVRTPGSPARWSRRLRAFFKGFLHGPKRI